MANSTTLTSNPSEKHDGKTEDGKTVVLYLNHSGQMSGAEMSLRSLLRALRQSEPGHHELGIEPVVALPGEGPFSQNLREDGFNVTLAPLRRLQRPRGLIDGMASVLHVLQTTPHVCRLIDQTGAQIIHSNSTTAHLVGGVAAEKTKKPALWHCRDLVALGKIAPQLAAKSARVLAISECVKARLIDDGVPESKINVVINGLDTDFWRHKKSQLRETLGIPDSAFLFGVVGQLVPWKNHARFIEAAANLVRDDRAENARFCIIGGDLWGEQASYVAELRALVKKHELVDRFNFIPNQTDAVDALSALDCLVHPALDEPFGRVLMEAMALKIPVIAMNANGPKEIVTHEHDGLLVEPDAASGVEKAMREVMDLPALRETLVINGRRTVEERFHSALHSAKIREIYRDVL